MIMYKPIKVYTLNLGEGYSREISPCYQVCRKDQYLVHSCFSYMIFLTWGPQHLLLSFPTTRSATGQSKAWRICDVQVKTMESQKDLGDLVTKHLKWNSQVLAAYSKANRMLGFLRRTAFDTHDQ